MNIQFKNGVTSEISVERAAKQATGSGVSTVQGLSQDHATLSTSGHTVSNLVQGVLSNPAVRQDRVNSLRDSLAAGTYKLDNVKIAGSILSEDGE